MRRSQAGQATVEWSAITLALALAFAALAVVVARTDAWRIGDGVVHALVCAIEGGCEERDALDLAYGEGVAQLVREHAPNVVYERRSAALPVAMPRAASPSSKKPAGIQACDRCRIHRTGRARVASGAQSHSLIACSAAASSASTAAACCS